MAIGLVGVGSGLGFYLGPKFSGWRAESAHWQFFNVARWQRPLIELGIAGMVCALLFLIVASETDHRKMPSKGRHMPLGQTLRRRVLMIAATLGLRDFAGVSSVSLVGIYLQKAHGMSVKQTGAILGSMMLITIFVNPLAVYLSPRGRRLPAMALLLLVGGVTFAMVPFVPAKFALVVLTVFQTFHLGSYAV